MDIALGKRPQVLDYAGWPSPFDAKGVQYAWDSTSLGLLKTCARKYQLTMVLNWQPKVKSYHLDFGILYHTAIEKYEHMMAEVGPVPTPFAHEYAVREVIHWVMRASKDYAPPEGKNDKTRFNLVRSLVWYFEEYGLNDNCDTVLLRGGKPAVELSFRFEIGRGLLLSGHLDRVVRFGENIFVMDHKTTTHTIDYASASRYFQQFSPDNQMSLYSVAAKVAFAQPISGVIVDATQIAVGFTRFARSVAHRTQGQLEEFIEGVYSYHSLAQHYAAMDFYPMNETACNNYGGCAFRNICNKDPRVRDKFLATDYTQDKPWNPLEPR